MGKWILLAVGLLIIIAAIYLSSTRGYGKVSDRSYKIATALYGACLSKSEARLETIGQLISDASEDSSDEPIPNRERAWLNSILQQAQDGDWESAAESCKRMMEDQVEY